MELNFKFDVQEWNKEQLVVARRGRPKGSKKEIEPTLTPTSEAGKEKYAKMEIRARRRKKEDAKIANRKRKAMLISRLQKRYFEEFKILEVNKYGAIYENPNKKYLGRIFIASKNANGEKLRNLYFPERGHADRFIKFMQKMEVELEINARMK